MKEVCFMDNYGVGNSHTVSDGFNSFLRSKEISDIIGTAAGIKSKEEIPEPLRDQMLNAQRGLFLEGDQEDVYSVFRGNISRADLLFLMKESRSEKERLYIRIINAEAPLLYFSDVQKKLGGNQINCTVILLKK